MNSQKRCVAASETNILLAKSKWDLFNLIIEFGKRVDPERHVEICRDPDDNHVIDVALAGEAEYVVTGDDDLLY